MKKNQHAMLQLVVMPILSLDLHVLKKPDYFKAKYPDKAQCSCEIKLVNNGQPTQQTMIRDYS